MFKWSALSAGALTFVLARPADAQVSQPDGTVMPQPAPAAELSCCVTGRGFATTADTLAGLFANNEINGGENPPLDPIKDAHTTPGTFAPQCGLSGTIVLHGGGCKNALGWYNATDPATVPKTIYTIVPANLQQPAPNGISCADPDFCPLASRTSTQPPPQHTWASPLPDFAANIRNSPNWAGGPVGFALIGNTVNGNVCPQTKYSQAEINAHSPAGGTTKGLPWVTTLIYQSTTDPNGYYIAFEDQPTCTGSWRGCNPGSDTQALTSGGNDGDFNDFVFYVTGIDCAGGGQACDSGKPGICAGGTTQCSNGGMDIKCRQDIQPRAETCNLLDDDCDGVIDNPDAPGLCPVGQVCSRGVCVSPCSTTEFPCGPPTVCDTSDGLCKDPRCMSANCKQDQICDRGVCVGGCEGVVCPPGQVCQIGNCVDPCNGIKCGDGQVCEGGACLAACGCRNCPSGKVCSPKAAPDPTAGTCIDKGCDKVTCKAPMVCVQGECKDGCAGVQCPAAQMCADGQCALPDGGIVVPPPDGGVSTTGTGGSTGTGGRTNTGGTTGVAGSSATGGSGAGGSTGHEGGIQTCSCETSSGPGPGGLALLLAALGISAARRRVRATARRRPR